MFQCQGYGLFQAECQKRRGLTIKVIEQSDQIIIEPSEEDPKKVEEANILTTEVRELWSSKGFTHHDESKGRKPKGAYHSLLMCYSREDVSQCCFIPFSR